MQGLIKAGYYQSAAEENFNLASGAEARIRDLVKMVNETTDNKADVIYGVPFVGARIHLLMINS